MSSSEHLVPSGSAVSAFPAAHGTIGVRRWPGPADRTTVVALPGVDATADALLPLAKALAGARPLLAIELRGRGAATTAGPWGVAAHADDVEHFLAERGVAGDERVILLGHSFGAHVAAEVARRVPHLVERLVLVDGGTPRSVAPDADRAVVAGTVATTICSRLGERGAAVSAEAIEADVRSMFCAPESNEALALVPVPITLIRAEHGVAPGLPAVVPDEAVAALVAALGSSARPTVLTVAGADHFSPMTEPAPEVVAALLQ